MSSSLTFLTSELQALSKEAGRRHPDVKEAADKALATLKANPDNALADLHQEQDAVSTSAPAKHPILLAPIVLGCATRNTKVVSIAVSGLQRLTSIRGAITQATVPVILNTLRTVLSQGVEIQLKTLQTLSSLLTNCKEIHADLLAETLLISFKLQESKIGVVSSTAAATLRQLVMFVFEAVDDEDRLLARSRDDPSVQGPVPTEFTVELPHAADEEVDSDSVEKKPYYLLPSAKDAYLLFEDICLLVNGESPSFLKLQSLPRTFGLELIESVLSDFSQVFRRHPELLHLLRTLLSPLLIRSLAEKPSFSTTLRLMRVMYLLLKKFIDDLSTEAEIFLSMFIKIVAPGEIEGSGGHPLSHAGLPSSASAANGKEAAGKTSNLINTSGSGSSPPWMRVLALEILRGLCGDFEFLSKIFTRYDGAPYHEASDSPQMEKNSSTTSIHETRPSSFSKRSVFRSMITALNRLATERPALLGTGTALVQGVPTDPNAADYSSVSGMVDGIVGIAQQAASTVGVAGYTGQEGLSLQTASVKLQCIDQLDKADAPNIPELYIFLLALQCLNAIADGFAGSALQAYQTLMNLRPWKDNESLPAPPALDLDKLPSEPAYNTLRTTKAMADAGWPALLASLSFFLTTNLDDDLFTHTLTSYQNFTTTCGVLNLKTPRDAFLISLCKFAVPPSIISHLAASENAPSQMTRQTTSSIITASTDALGLTSQASHTQTMCLSTRNLLCLRSLVGVSQALAGSLEKTWFYIFEALQNADFVVRADISRRQKKRSTPASTASTSHSSPAKTASSAMAGTGSSSSSAPSASPLSRFIPSDADEQAAQQRNARLFEVSRALDDDAFRWFVASLCRLNGEMIGIPTSETGGYNDADSSVIMSPTLEEGFVKQPKRTGINVLRTLRHGERSYATTKLGEVALMNMQRLIARPSEIGWDIIISHLLLIQHWQSAQSNVRTHAAEVFDKIVSAVPKDVEKEPEEAQRRAQEQVLQALSEQAELQSRSQSSTDIEIRKASLDTLLRILESHGHSLLCGWTVIFNILRLACPPITGTSGERRASEQLDPTSVGRNPLLVRVAFPSLQLICSDFLAALSKRELDICIVTLAEFGKQIEDVNVALTAGNLLWQVSDHVQMKHRQTGEGHDYLDLWMALLLRFLELCSDRRQEVRDGAIQILWRSIELYGGSLDPAYWEQCLWKVIFPLLRSLDEGLRSVEEDKDADGEVTPMGVPLLHKQWDDSKVLALASAGSVFFNELPTSLYQLESFSKVCTTLVEYIQESFITNRPAVATAAMKCLDRICTAVWPEDRKERGVFVARTAWDACIAIGNQIVQHEKRDLTQQNLEAYTSVLLNLQAGGYIPFTLEECQQLLSILKGIITYPYSPDYRLDQDVLSPLQVAVLKVLDRVELSSHEVAAIVLEDLSEYMSLAYTHDGQSSQLATSAPGTLKRQNQKVTYIALSKTSTNKIVEIYHRFETEPAIYTSAVERIFSAYIIPLKLKYECPPPSRYGEETPLWKTATLHFLELAKAAVTFLDELGSNVDGETIAYIWRKVIEGYRAILEADNDPVLGMTLVQQRAEEDFEYAVLSSLEADIVPKLGNSSIPDDAIIALARSLSTASNLHEPKHEEVPQTANSPKANGNLRSHALPAGSTEDEIDLPRERFSYWCLDLLFMMCAGDTERQRVSEHSIPMLMTRCKRVLESYLADSEIRGLFPFSRVREEEVVYVLSKLSQLELWQGSFAAAYSRKASQQPVSQDNGQESNNVPDKPLSSACRQSTRAHLFELYPLLVGFLSLASEDKTGHPAVPYRAIYSQGRVTSASDSNTNRVVQPLLAESAKTLARRCLDIVGHELGHTLS